MVDSLFPYAPHYLDREGHKLHYIDEGEGEAILMLHGNPTWSFYYRHLIEALRSRYRVIVPDHMGCGRSDKPADYNYCLETHIQNIEKLVERLDLKSVNLVVHDWGGAIGMGLSTRHPDLIHRIVLLNTAAFRFEWMPFRIRLCRVPLLGNLLIRGLNVFSRAALSQAVTKPLSAEVRAGYLEPYNNWANRIAQHRFVQDIPMSKNHPSMATLEAIEKGLPQLQYKPQLILWGEKDFCFNLRFLDRWRQIFPKAKVHTFPKAGHYVLEDARDEIAELVTDFLEIPLPASTLASLS